MDTSSAMMKIEQTKIEDLKHDPENLRLHDHANISAIAGSLKKFGQQKPIVVDEAGIVIAGNGTLEAAKSLGWATVQTVTTKLKGTEKKAFAIADNRAAELAVWDEAALESALTGLQEANFDVSEIGFDWADDLQADTLSYFGGESPEEDKLKKYLECETRVMKLMLENDQFENLTGNLGKIMEQQNLKSHSEAVHFAAKAYCEMVGTEDI